MESKEQVITHLIRGEIRNRRIETKSRQTNLNTVDLGPVHRESPKLISTLSIQACRFSKRI
jgi:hypothetical protein